MRNPWNPEGIDNHVVIQDGCHRCPLKALREEGLFLAVGGAERGQGIGHAADAYFVEMETRRATYDQITQVGQPPVVVLSETAAILESAFAGASADRQKLLVLLFDLVPVDEYGGVLEDIELSP